MDGDTWDLRRMIREAVGEALRRELPLLLHTQALEAPKRPDLPELLTVNEAAEAMRCGKSKAYDLINRGILRAVRNGRSVRVRREDVARWLQQNTESGGPP